jgi:hypothetical protein
MLRETRRHLEIKADPACHARHIDLDDVVAFQRVVER